MARPSWAPEGLDIERPTASRAYDYVLGGIHNFPADRELARRLMETMPDLATHARANRAFLQRSVKFLVEAGVRQFLDIGSGIPTVGNVHEVAQKIAPESRIVYVDIDEVAVAHSEHILAETERCAVIREDLRNLDRILDHPHVKRLLDFTQPVAVLLLALLHAIPDSDNPRGILATLHGVLAPGSYLAISHATFEARPTEAHQLEQVTKDRPTALHMRTRDAIAALFTGFDLVDPGLVWVSQWRPDGSLGAPADKSDMLMAGVGRKP